MREAPFTVLPLAHKDMGGRWRTIYGFEEDGRWSLSVAELITMFFL